MTLLHESRSGFACRRPPLWRRHQRTKILAQRLSRGPHNGYEVVKRHEPFEVVVTQETQDRLAERHGLDGHTTVPAHEELIDHEIGGGQVIMNVAVRHPFNQCELNG